MSFWTYILKCADGSYYTGHTDNLEQRMGEHHGGVLPCYTQDKRPLALVWSDYFQTREEALITERLIKGWSRAKKEALILPQFKGWQRRTSAKAALKPFDTALRVRSAPTQGEQMRERTMPNVLRSS